MLIQVNHLFAGYDNRTVLQDISLTLDAGELVGLIGPNGAGKSTLLRGITGVIPISKGETLYGEMNRDKLNARQRARHVTFMPQSEPTLFDFTVKDVVLMGRHPWRPPGKGYTTEDFDIVVRAMTAADILHISERTITALSGGEHRRVLLARALAQNTPALLMDEPTAHLDLTHQAEVLNLIRNRTRNEGVGALAALHDINLAAEYCDRLILLSHGSILREGTPQEVFNAELLERAYGSRLHVSVNPATGTPFASPMPIEENEYARGARVHVICGGGTGSAALAALYRHGIKVTAGVLNRLDTDQQTAEALGIEQVVDAPFSPIGAECLARARELISKAQWVLVTDCPFGRGNLANLQLALEALKQGAKVYLPASPAIETRDFTEGKATALWRTLLESGARTWTDPDAFLMELFNSSKNPPALAEKEIEM
jgi:iron complex transport system ATP-binding protein